MKISNIDKFPLMLPAKKQGWTEDEFVWPSQTPSVIIRINTDKGISGVGEATSQVWYLGETQEHMLKLIELFEQRLIGEDPTNMSRIHGIMDRTASGGAPTSRAAFSAIDMAVFDIIGKVQQRPVYEVLGGAYRTKLELLTNLYHKSPQSMAEACKKYVDKGFRGLKVKVGDILLNKGWSPRNFNEEIDKLLAALEVVPNEIYVDADANQAWKSPKLTVNTVQKRLNGFTNLSIEQPLQYFNLSGHSYVRKSIDCPVILDESVLSPEIMIEIVKSEAADRIVMKLNRVGGFWPARKIIDIAEASAIGISVDTNPFTKIGDTALCHLAATIKDPYPVDAEGHISFIERFDPDPFPGGVEIKAGYAILPDAPGLGIELDEKELNGFAGSIES
ncbi:MAG: mandelate racemase/muconate lactonizing enzyme family protein [Candidatus Bipolaricaulia bacterium]